MAIYPFTITDSQLRPLTARITTPELGLKVVRAIRVAGPNVTAEQIRAAFEADEFDPLKEFSAACRMELLAMSSIM